MFKKVINITLVLTFIATQVAYPLPQDVQVVEGTADVAVDGSTMTINASNNTIINYSSFDIAQNEAVIVNLPDASSQILNKVIGPDSSNLGGMLQCNGLFILINTHGIFVAPTANIDVQSLILSTRDITNENFLNKDYIFQKISEEELDKLLKVAGNINIREGGFGVLIAGGIENTGTIIAPIGKIALAAGDAIKLDISQGGLISVAILEEQAREVLDAEGSPITDQIKNTGTIEAQGGTVILNAESITDVFTKAINLEGTVRAETVTITADKDIHLKGDIETSGNIDIYSQEGLIDLRNPVTPPTLYTHYGSINLENHDKGINIYGTLNAPEGQIRLWTDGDLDLRGATCISKEGGYIYNPFDAILVTWDGGAGTSSWADALNWSGDAVPSGNNYDVTIDTENASVYTTTAVTIGDLAIGTTNTSTLTLDGTLTLDANVGQGTSGNLTIGATGTLDLNGQNLAMEGTFSNDGTLRLLGNETLNPFTNDTDSGTIEYYGTGTYETLAAGNNYYNLVFNSSCYRSQIDITNSSDSDLTDYQVKIELDSSFAFDNSTNDGRDIRFYDSNGNSLNFWIESWNQASESATIWVKVPSLPKGESTAIYVHYGDSSLSSASSGSSTFDYFDDFSTDTTADYTISSWSSGYNNLYYSASNEAMWFDTADDKACFINRQNLDLPSSGVTILNVNVVAEYPAEERIYYYSTQGGVGYYFYETDGYGSGYYDRLIKNVSGDSQTVTQNGTCTHSSFCLRAYWTPTSMKWTKNGNTIMSINPTSNSTELVPDKITFGGNQIKMYLYDIKVRKYNSTEPSTSVGTESLTAKDGTFALPENSTLDISGNLVLTAGSFNASLGTVDLDGNISIAENQTFIAPSGNMNIEGSFTNTSGTFTHSYGTVTFDSTVTEKEITSGSSSFNNIIFDNASGSWVLQDTLDVDQNLTITQGELDANGKNITVGGNWTNSGTFTHNNNTVTFDNCGSHTIDTGSSNFYNISFPTSGTYTLESDLVIEGNISFMTVWVNNYSYRKLITIDKDKVTGNLENLPVLISITDTDLKWNDPGTPEQEGYVTNQNGYDIIFTDITGNQLDHEMASYDEDAGTATFWIKAPALYNDTDSYMYIFYGNNNVSTSQENVSGVWSSYNGIWHMDETSGTVCDATVNNNDATPSFDGSGTQDATGKIGGADYFDGDGDYINVDLSQSVTCYSYWAKSPAGEWTYYVDVNGTQYVNGVASSFDRYIDANLYIGTKQRSQPNEVSNITLWFDADDLTGSDGASVETWYDKSGRADNATQTTSSSYRPALYNDVINGHKVLKFDGSDYFEVGRIRDSQGGYHAFVVSQKTSASGGDWQRIAASWDGYSGGDWQGASWQMYPPYGTNGAPIAYDPCVRTFSSSSGKEIDYFYIATNAKYPTPGGDTFTGNIAEIIVYSRQLTTEEVNSITAYLSIKYDIDSTNYYFNGTIDEARVSGTAHSAGWVSTEYNNQSSPSTFINFGNRTAQETGSATINVGNNNLTIGGNFSNSGGTLNNLSNVTFIDASKTSQITGSNTFNNLTCEVGGKTLEFQTGETQTIQGTLTLKPNDNINIILRSQTPGSLWKIAPVNPVTQDKVDYVEVTDSDNLGDAITVYNGQVTNCIGWNKYVPPSNKTITSPDQSQIDRATFMIDKDPDTPGYIQQENIRTFIDKGLLPNIYMSEDLRRVINVEYLKDDFRLNRDWLNLGRDRMGLETRKNKDKSSIIIGNVLEGDRDDA